VDLALFISVLRRHKTIVFSGFVLAIVLAFLSFARVGTNGVAYRQKEQWVSYSTMLVSQAGFPWGSLNGEQSHPRQSDGQPLGRSTQAADPNRLTALAIIYAHLADSDPVQRIIRASGPLNGKIEAAPLPAVTGATEVLPIVSIAAFADSRRGAISLARRDSSALATYIEQQQVANGIRVSERVLLSQVSKPVDAKLFAGRSMTLPVVVFLAVLFAAAAAAFVHENMTSSRSLAVPGEGAAPVPTAEAAA
jgi:hypothetical protein